MSKQALPRWGAYLSTGEYREDAELTRVGRGTPAGEYLRRFWQPVGFVEELGDVPTRIRILGEDLALFRDQEGNIGLLALHCSHRGASLEYAVIEKRGVRCFYHGWKYDIDGTVLETPGGAPLGGGALVHGAYPTLVFHGMIFAYLGPPDKKPPFPLLDVYDFEHIHVEAAPARTGIMECNWLQIQENGMDPVHTAFLHVLVSGKQRGFSDEMGIVPELEFRELDDGVHYIASRRVGECVWVRIVDLMLGNMSLIPPDDQEGAKAGVSQGPFTIIWAVPIDDENTKRFYLLLEDERAPLKDYQKVRAFGQANDRPYADRQRHPGDYDAMTSQGPINIHAYENLAVSDRGVILFRDHLRREIRAVQAGRDPTGIARDGVKRLRTRTQNTVLDAPRAGRPDLDAELLKEIGRRVADADLRRELPPA